MAEHLLPRRSRRHPLAAQNLASASALLTDALAASMGAFADVLNVQRLVLLRANEDQLEPVLVRA